MKNKTNELSQHDIIRSNHERRRTVLLIFLVTAALLLGSSTHPDAVITSQDWIYVIVSYIALITMVWSSVQSYRESDEFQRVVQLKAAAITLIVVMLVLFISSNLDILGIPTSISIIQNLSLGGILCYAFVYFVLNRKHS